MQEYFLPIKVIHERLRYLFLLLRRPVTVAICVVLTAILSGVVIYQYNKLSRIQRVSKAAQSLVEKRRMEFVDSGFIQASLAFLEQNKDLYPDSYKRGIQVAAKSKQDRIYGELNSASEIEGIIKGIAILNNED
jgi:hypothetical protein